MVSGAGDQGGKDQNHDMERYIMELKQNRKSRKRLSQRGMSLIELMFAMVVLLVGVVGSMGLIAYTIGGNHRQKKHCSVATAFSRRVSYSAQFRPTAARPHC